MSRASAPLLKAADVAQRLNLSLSQVYELARTGQLPVVRIGAAVRFDPADITAAAKARRVVTKPKPRPVPVQPVRRTRSKPIRAEQRLLMRPDLA